MLSTDDFTVIRERFAARSDRNWAQDPFSRGEFVELISRMEADEADYGRWKILRIRIDPDGTLHGSPETEGSAPGRLALETLAEVITGYLPMLDTSEPGG